MARGETDRPPLAFLSMCVLRLQRYPMATLSTTLQKIEKCDPEEKAASIKILDSVI